MPLRSRSAILCLCLACQPWGTRHHLQGTLSLTLDIPSPQGNPVTHSLMLNIQHLLKLGTNNKEVILLPIRDTQVLPMATKMPIRGIPVPLKGTQVPKCTLVLTKATRQLPKNPKCNRGTLKVTLSHIVNMLMVNQAQYQHQSQNPRWSP